MRINLERTPMILSFLTRNPDSSQGNNCPTLELSFYVELSKENKGDSINLMVILANDIGIFPFKSAPTESNNFWYTSNSVHIAYKSTILVTLNNPFKFETYTAFRIPNTVFSITSSNTAFITHGLPAGQNLYDNATLSPFTKSTKYRC